jgi:large subunit ribosomal protein L21
MDYAIVETGGKQYTVHPGDTLQVEKLSAAQEEVLELDRVLLVAKDGIVKVGQPLVEGARVKAEVVEHGKAPKVTVFKFKPKVRYKRKVGHRQQYTELKITEIVDGEQPPAPRRQAVRWSVNKGWHNHRQATRHSNTVR